MEYRHTFIRLVLYVICLFASIGVMPTKSHAQVTPFLYRPYYGPSLTSQIISAFDHNNASSVYTSYNQLCPGSNPVQPSYDGHGGTDFPLTYQPVVAAAAGTIEWSGWSNTNHSQNVGLGMKIGHANGYRTVYGHMSMLRYASGVVVGQYQIGTSGNTGYTNIPHLHFEARNIDSFYNRVDPYGWNCGNNPPDPFNIPNPYLFVANALQSPPPYNGDYPLNDTSISIICLSTPCASWTSDTSTGYGGQHKYFFSTGSTNIGLYAEWTASGANIPDSGQYEIEVFVPTYPNSSCSGINSKRGANARYQITYSGQSITVVVDQRLVDWDSDTWPPDQNCGFYAGTGRWISLGRYNFANNNLNSVQLYNAGTFCGNWTQPVSIGQQCEYDATDKRLIVDAVRWRKTH